MSRIIRLFSLVTLCLALALGSVSMAVARGQASALSSGGTTLVICSGYGVMTVTLDGEGNPVGPVHLCPECLAGLSAYLPPDSPAYTPELLARALVVVLDYIAAPRTAGVLITRARGPPLVG
jgi:hypothetical protein